MFVITIHQRYGRTDRRTDGGTSYGNTVLCVTSRDKNEISIALCAENNQVDFGRNAD